MAAVPLFLYGKSSFSLKGVVNCGGAEGDRPWVSWPKAAGLFPNRTATKTTAIANTIMVSLIYRGTQNNLHGQFPATRYPAFSASAALLNTTLFCGATWL